MTNFYRASNKRMIARAGNGRFRKTIIDDLCGKTGYCEKHKCWMFIRPKYQGSFVDPFSMNNPVCDKCEEERAR